MKFLASSFTLAILIAAGCQSSPKSSSIPPDNSATDLSVATPASPDASATAVTPIPAAAPAAEPIVTETPSAASGSTYTIKKGDTLYGIARSKYGDGKQWQRIASANPGLSPSKLHVGQTIVLP